ncbi:MAG TPA: DinB family protein [Candidatus Angelobacter sp.]|nr:DinB family protein [Candidatus Angelobacter sp.]
MKARIAVYCLLLSLFATVTTIAAGAQGAADAKPTFASVIDAQRSSAEKIVVPAAEAMPEDKFNFAPTQGEYKSVRTFGAEIKHMAVANYAYASGILGEKPPVDLGGGPDGPANVKSKAEIVQFLKDSFVYAHKAVNTIDEKNVLEPIKAPFGSGMTTRLALAIRACSHPYDHYGQMVEYLRMNGIIPPASRK